MIPFRLIRIFGQLGLSALFLIAAYTKYTEPFYFGNQLVAYELPLHYTVIDTLVWLIPTIETIIAIGLLLGIYTKKIATLAALLIATFTLMVAIALLRGLDIDCGCFGIPQPIGWKKILENTVLFSVAVYVRYFPAYACFPNCTRYN